MPKCNKEIKFCNFCFSSILCLKLAKAPCTVQLLCVNVYTVNGSHYFCATLYSRCRYHSYRIIAAKTMYTSDKQVANYTSCAIMNNNKGKKHQYISATLYMRRITFFHTLLGTTVFRGMRNFEPSRGICPFLRNFYIFTEFRGIRHWMVIREQIWHTLMEFGPLYCMYA